MINMKISNLAALNLQAILLLALMGCERPPTALGTKPMADVLGQATNETTDSAFSSVVLGYKFEFPRDHLPHKSFRQEWWYLTANLTTAQGEQLGAQWTQFRIALKPPEVSPQSQSSWASEQLYFAHSALTSASTHLANEKWSRGHPELAGITANPYRIRLDNWQWLSESRELFPAILTVENTDFSYRLKLNSQAPLQYQGEHGYSIKSRDSQVASYYYSQPFIDISGEINRNGKAERVTGKGWLDREWSSQFLTKTQQGWDWFALRLNDGSTLMLFQLREQPHENVPLNSPISAFYSARRMFADGTGRNINSLDQPDGIKITPLKWQQTAKETYPVNWQVQIPSEHIDLTITPLNPNSAMPLSTSYWEGPVALIGSHTGTGYMELTGY